MELTSEANDTVGTGVAGEGIVVGVPTVNCEGGPPVEVGEEGQLLEGIAVAVFPGDGGNGDAANDISSFII